MGVQLGNTHGFASCAFVMDPGTATACTRVGEGKVGRTVWVCGTVTHGFTWLQMASDGFRWLQVASNGFKWLQMASDGFRWLQMASDGFRWLQMASPAARFCYGTPPGAANAYVWRHTSCFICYGMPSNRCGWLTCGRRPAWPPRPQYGEVLLSQVVAPHEKHLHASSTFASGPHTIPPHSIGTWL